ncbi:hypothetical protein BD769DRAFT_1471015 [Suillus cothurnatus]|nr:hypothetical protein BD769DRAFT_1471015 [Suillus cothurnatus]
MLWMHTLKVEINSDMGRITFRTRIASNFVASPSILQAVLTILPKTTFKISIEVNKAFLTENRPDVMRGWDIPVSDVVFFPLPQLSHDTFRVMIGRGFISRHFLSTSPPQISACLITSLSSAVRSCH